MWTQVFIMRSLTRPLLIHLIACLDQALLRSLNPHAHIVATNHSRVPLSEVLNTGRFSFERAQQAAGWLQVRVIPLGSFATLTSAC